MFFKLIKVHLLVSELYIHQNARCKDKKKIGKLCASWHLCACGRITRTFATGNLVTSVYRKHKNKRT